MLTIDKAKSILCKRLGFNDISIVCNNKEFFERFKNYYKIVGKSQNTNNEYFITMSRMNFKTLFDIYSVIIPC